MTETDTGTVGGDSDGSVVDALGERDGWHTEAFAARVHYRGADDHYSVEYYAPSDCVVYWKVKGDGETAVPVSRDTVPDPLRERVRIDLDAAGADPQIEARML
jgi:hypothetical protein